MNNNFSKIDIENIKALYNDKLFKYKFLFFLQIILILSFIIKLILMLFAISFLKFVNPLTSILLTIGLGYALGNTNKKIKKYNQRLQKLSKMS